MSRQSKPSANDLIQEFFDVVGQRVAIQSAGGDPDKEIGIFGDLSPMTRSLVMSRYEERMRQEVDFLLNDPDVIEARQLSDALVQQSKAANAAFYDWHNGEGAGAPMDQVIQKYFELFEPIQLPEEVRSRYSELARGITDKLKGISPKLTAYSHPDLKPIFKTLSGISGVTPPSFEDGVAMPLYTVPGGEEGALGFFSETAIAASLGFEAAVEGLVNTPLQLAKGSWNAFAWMKGMATNKWGDADFPLEFLIPKDYVYDPETNRMVAVDAPITIPHLWHGMANALGAESAEKALQAIDDESATVKWMRNRDAPWAIKMLDEAAMFSGGLWSFNKLAGRPLGWGADVGEKVGLGLAKVVTGAKGAEKVAKVMQKAGQAVGGAVAFGSFEGLSAGAKTPEEMWTHFEDGVRSGLVFHYMGMLHNATSKALMKKRIPYKIAERLGAAAAGLGFATYELGVENALPFQKTDMGQALHDFVRDPTESSWEHYARVIGKNVLGMMLHSTMFGRHAAMENARRAATEMVQKQAAETSKKKQVVFEEYVSEAAKGGEPAKPAEPFGPQPLPKWRGKPEIEPALATPEGTMKEGLLIRLQNRLIRRQAERGEKGPEKVPLREIGGVIMRPMLGGKAWGNVIRGNDRLDPQPHVNIGKADRLLVDRMAKDLGRETATALASHLRTGGRAVTFHTHDMPLSFSEADVKLFTNWYFSRGGQEPQILIREDKIQVALPKKGYRQRTTEENSEKLAVASEVFWNGLRDWAQRVADKHGLNWEEFRKQPGKYFRGEALEPKYKEAMAEVRTWMDQIGMPKMAEVMGIDVISLDAPSAQRALDTWLETGNTSVFRKPPTARPESKYIADTIRQILRTSREEPIDVSPNSLYQVRLTARTQGLEAAWAELRDYVVGESVEKLPKTQENFEILLNALEGRPVPLPRGWEVGPSAVRSYELGQRREPIRLESVQEIRENEQTIREALGRPGDRRVKERVALKERIKGLWRGLTTFDPIKDVGYLRPFRGPDMEALVAAAGRRAKGASEARTQVQVDMASVMKHLIPPKESGLSRKDRIRIEADNLRQLEIYGGLKDLVGNYMQKRWVLNEETGDLEFKDVPSKLPGGYKIEDFQKALAKMEGELRPEVRAAYEQIRKVLDQAWGEFAVRKGFDPALKETDYWPREVKDFVDLKHMGAEKSKGGPRDPFRSYAKQRTGTERATEFSIEGVEAYLTKIRYDNVIHDWLREVGDAITERAEKETGLTVSQMRDLSDSDWKDFYDNFLQEKGFLTVDLRSGNRGRFQYDRSPEAWDSYFALRGAIPDMPAIGRRLKPNEKDTFLMTRQAVELMLREKQRSFFESPTWSRVNKIIGEWFKVPALRGPGGILTPARVVRNLVSDLAKVFEQDSLRAAIKTAQQMGYAKNIMRKVAKNQKLDITEQSLWEEFNYYGTGSRGEFTGLPGNPDIPILQRYDPSLQPTWRKIIDGVRGDTRWAERMDMFAENWVRFSYFLGERMQHRDVPIQIWGEKGLDRFSREQKDLLRDLHFKGGRTLINYDWLTPFERIALNGTLVPFYTWARWNLAGTAAALREAPVSAAARMALPGLAMHLFNLAVFGNDEQRLVDKWPGIASRPHLILPVKDSLGNPLVMWMQVPSAEGFAFLGLDGIFARAPGAAMAIAQGEPGAAFQKLVRGTFEDATQAAQRMVNPFIREALAGEARTKFAGIPQVSSQTFTGLGAMLPTVRTGLQVADILTEVAGVAGGVRPERTPEAEAATFVPFFSFIDHSEGLPWSAQVEEYQIGKAQSDEAKMSIRFKRYSRMFMTALVSRDTDKARRVFESAWGDVEPMASRYGLTREMVLARMVQSAKREAHKKALIETGRAPKLATISKRQAAMLYERITQ